MLCLLALLAGLQTQAESESLAGHYNVVFIVADDLNDYVSVLQDHPQAKTPNLDKFSDSAINFTNAQAPAGWCSPSRVSFLTGTQPYHSKFRAQGYLNNHETLKHNIPIQEYFKNRGYQSLSFGKTEHNANYTGWSTVVQKISYGPFWRDDSGYSFHPAPTQAPTVEYSRDGAMVTGGLFNFAISGTPNADPFENEVSDHFMTFGSLERAEGINNGVWTNRWRRVSKDLPGFPAGYMTADRINALLIQKLMEEDPEAVVRLLELDKGQRDSDFGKPFKGTWENKLEERFFINVGFVRPHTPIHSELAHFRAIAHDLGDIDLLAPQDALLANFTFDKNWRNNTDPEFTRAQKRLHALYEDYEGDLKRGLKELTHAYLASIHDFDTNVGIILDSIASNGYKENTIVIITSDHGWHNGEFNEIGKDTVFEETCRVPLMIRVPSLPGGGDCDIPVSLVDIYPTLLDLCRIEGDPTVRNSNGVSLGGYNLVPLLENPNTSSWTGPRVAITTINPGNGGRRDTLKQENEEMLSYSVRAMSYRYVRQANNSGEMLFEMVDGKLDQTNDVSHKYKHVVEALSEELDKMIQRGSFVDAGPDQVIKLGVEGKQIVTLKGSILATDDIEIAWRQVSGPDAMITDPGKDQTHVTLQKAGEYIFEFSATNIPYDEAGEGSGADPFIASDRVTITVKDATSLSMSGF